MNYFLVSSSGHLNRSTKVDLIAQLSNSGKLLINDR